MVGSCKDRCLRGRIHLRTGMKMIIGVGIAVLIGLTVLLAIYFRKALFILSIPAIVTLLSAGAVFRRDHRFVWPLFGISCFHIFLTLNVLLVFAFYFFFKPLYILMVFNWAFDTLDTGKNPAYYVKCFFIALGLFAFLFYNVWQAAIAKYFLDHLKENELDLNEHVKVSGSSSSSVALNFSHTNSPKMERHEHSAIVFVGGPELQPMSEKSDRNF